MNSLESIVTATKEVFSGMLFMEVTPLDPIAPGKTHTESISAIIGFGGRMKGMLAVHTPDEVAKAITSGFLDIPIETINEDVKDAIGELANMLAGAVKLALSKNSNDIGLSIPSVICGDSYTINAPTEGEALLIPFAVESGQFFVEFHVIEAPS